MYKILVSFEPNSQSWQVNLNWVNKKIFPSLKSHKSLHSTEMYIFITKDIFILLINNVKIYNTIFFNMDKFRTAPILDFKATN